MSTRIERPATAFAETGRQKKHPRREDKAHLKFLRELPCLVSGRRPVEAAHVRFGDMAYGKRSTGKAERPDDRWCVPLHRDLHREQHDAGDERAWWRSKNLDPLPLCLALYDASGDHETAELIIKAANTRAKQEPAS